MVHAMAHRTDTRASLALSVGDPVGPYTGQRELGGDEEAVRHRENQREDDLNGHAAGDTR